MYTGATCVVVSCFASAELLEIASTAIRNSKGVIPRDPKGTRQFWSSNPLANSILKPLIGSNQPQVLNFQKQMCFFTLRRYLPCVNSLSQYITSMVSDNHLSNATRKTVIFQIFPSDFYFRPFIHVLLFIIFTGVNQTL